MKNILILCLALLTLSCGKTEEKPVDYAIVSGKITNTNGKVTINSQDRKFTKPLELATDGSFTDTLSIDKNAYVIYDGKTPVALYLEPGYNVAINYDSNDVVNTLAFSGEGAATNQYLIEKQKNTKEVVGDIYETYKKDEAEFKEKAKELKSSTTMLLNKFQDISSSFKSLEENEINYNYLSLLSQYERMHSYMIKDNAFKVSENFLDELKDLDYSNEDDYSFSSSYRGLVTNKYQIDAQALAEDGSVTSDIAYLKTVGAIQSVKIKEDLLFKFANQSMSYAQDIDTFYKLYTDNSTNTENNKVIEEKYNKLMKLAKGKPSPMFADYKNYAGGTASLKDMQGKFVYIDVWATWCGPCKREIPFLKKVEKQYHNKNIEFVSVSIDKEKDFDKWKKMVDEKELGGTQLFADNDWKSQFVQDYEIQGIPRFILIDPDGNIVSSNAPRPSDPALVKMFDELNI